MNDQKHIAVCSMEETGLSSFPRGDNEKVKKEVRAGERD